MRHPLPSLLPSLFVTSSTDCWAVWAKNNAKTAVLVAVEAKLEVEIWQRPIKINFFDPGFLFTPSDSF